MIISVLILLIVHILGVFGGVLDIAIMKYYEGDIKEELVQVLNESQDDIVINGTFLNLYLEGQGNSVIEDINNKKVRFTRNSEGYEVTEDTSGKKEYEFQTVKKIAKVRKIRKLSFYFIIAIGIGVFYYWLSKRKIVYRIDKV
jgi:hypothetical protein